MSALDLFTYEGQQVRTVVVDGEPWFVLTDLCRVLDLSNPSMVRDRVDPDALSTAEVIDSMGRTQSAATVNESGLYEVIFLSRKPEARAFKRWITHEVLPQIRKTGGYGRPNVEQITRADLARMILAAEAERDAAEQLAAEREIPARAWDELASAEGDYSVGDAAKVLASLDVSLATIAARAEAHTQDAA